MDIDCSCLDFHCSFALSTARSCGSQRKESFERNWAKRDCYFSSLRCVQIGAHAQREFYRCPGTVETTEAAKQFFRRSNDFNRYGLSGTRNCSATNTLALTTAIRNEKFVFLFSTGSVSRVSRALRADTVRVFPRAARVTFSAYHRTNEERFIFICFSKLSRRRYKFYDEFRAAKISGHLLRLCKTLLCNKSVCQGVSIYCLRNWKYFQRKLNHCYCYVYCAPVVRSLLRRGIFSLSRVTNFVQGGNNSKILQQLVS